MHTVLLPEFGGEGLGTCPLRNVAPADLKQDAGGFDLPIGLGLLLGSGQVAFDRLGTFSIVGELALTGETRPIKSAMGLLRAGEALMAIRPFRPPHHCGTDAGLVGGGTILQPGGARSR
jgi:predicted ATPase with chaperone activity